MKRAAKVISVSALGDFKAALAKFGEQVKVALIEANSDMQRTVNRLQSDVLAHWRHEVKLWTRKVAEAKSELYKAQLQSREERPSATLERKALEKAQARLQHAEQKIQRIKYWVRVIEKDAMLCRGQLQQLDRVIDADLPRVSAQLDRMMQSLDDYLRVNSEAGPEGGLEDPRSSDAASGVVAAPPEDGVEMKADAPEEDQPDEDEPEEDEK